MLTKVTRLMHTGQRNAAAFAGRRRFIRSLRPMDIFVVTYPKSGTNWLRFFLANIMLSRHSEQPTQLTLRNCGNYVPDANSEYFGRISLDKYGNLPDPRIFTVHAPYEDRLPRVVYVVRDPRDVLLSYYYYHKRNVPDFGMPMDDFVAQRDLWPGDWGAHVSGWLDHAEPNRVLLVRYEDLLFDTTQQFHRILDFCDITYSSEVLERAVASSSFGNMQSLEAQFGVREVRGDSNVPLMRRGKHGAWRDELSEASIALIEDRYSSLMERLGYGLESA